MRIFKNNHKILGFVSMFSAFFILIVAFLLIFNVESFVGGLGNFFEKGLVGEPNLLFATIIAASLTAFFSALPILRLAFLLFGLILFIISIGVLKKKKIAILSLFILIILFFIFNIYFLLEFFSLFFLILIIFTVLMGVISLRLLLEKE